MKTVIIDGIEYVEKHTGDEMDYVIIRTQSAGVFAGFLKKKDGNEVELLEARRLWYWDGAASLSQLSIDGVKNPCNCKFPEKVDKIVLLGVIEIINCTSKAKKSIEGVPIWKA